MHSDVSRYRRNLKKQLTCGPLTRKRLLSRFGCSLTPFLEENPSPSYEQLVSAFGSPVEMAAILMQPVSAKEQVRYKTCKKIIRILAVVAAALLICFALYVFFVKEFTIITFRDELIPGTTVTISGGN